MPLKDDTARRREAADYMRLRRLPRQGEQAVGEQAHGAGLHPDIRWCPGCREDALPHDGTGRCMWCDTLLVQPAATDGEAAA